ncbi:flavin monoamine oxidase family protein [Rubrimonas sp.]|uniref:flavin monoamine oxidase family protein n=1 Tax=Rubrimonas sp. TaxID=2036015 RepID=UPI002FDEF44B
MQNEAQRHAAIPSDPEVVIVGAGAAGMAASRRLAKRKVSHVVVEGANRVGGRAWTSRTEFGAPVDMGCSWVSGSDGNSLAKIARRGPFTLVDHTDAPESLFVDGRRATGEEWAAYRDAQDAVDRALRKAGRKGRAVPAIDVLPKDLAFSGTVQSWLGAMDYGVDFRDLSPMDHWEQADDQPSCFVREGLGTVVETLADGAPIALGARVTAIDWSGPGVSVETTRGVVRARICLVTVSTGVLASGAIRFAPELPLAKREAIHDVPMGLLVKVPLLFDGARFGLRDGEIVTYRVPDETPAPACFFIAWPCGHDYMFGNIGGAFGWEMSRAGEAATVDFALGELVKLLGSDIRRRFVKGIMTPWADDPFSLGAYSVQRPGRTGAREALGTPIADRLFFAGEAVNAERAALVNGAYDSGVRAAKRIARALRG